MQNVQFSYDLSDVLVHSSVKSPCVGTNRCASVTEHINTNFMSALLTGDVVVCVQTLLSP